LTLIHQTIRAEYIPALLDNGHYFIPCKDFRDKEEFRYGYCLWNYADISSDALEECVEGTRKDATVNHWVNSTGISCWVSELKDEERMWREHGMGKPAIRISVQQDAFLDAVQRALHQTASGRTIYGGIPSYVRPQFQIRWNLGEAEDRVYHLFFHKRLQFDWEAEFRVVSFANAGIFIPRVPEIESVIASPLAPLDQGLIKSLRETFGSRFYDCPNDFRAAQEALASSATLIPRKRTPQNAELVQRLEKLEAEERIDGTGWNDPKTPPEKVERMLKRAKEMHELKQRIKQLDQAS
jgi:hypothetical protein